MFEWYIYTSLHRNKLHTHENIPSSSTKSLVQHKHILYSLSNYILMYPMGIKCLQPKQLETRTVSKIIKVPPFCKNDNLLWIITLDINRIVITFHHKYPQVVYMYYSCVKFHQYWLICLDGVALTRNMDIPTHRQMDRMIPVYLPKSLFAWV